MRKILISLAVSLISVAINANVRLPAIFSSNMVLQRDQVVELWGWAESGEKIEVTCGRVCLNTIAGADGCWNVSLPPFPAGGPYTVEVKGENVVRFNNVLFGDVFFCSGQSNMEWPVSHSDDFDGITKANCQDIRIYNVPKQTSAYPLSETEKAEWSPATPEAIASFSAVAYSFGFNLNKNLKVPIGLINASWGGTKIEAWMSRNSLAKFDFLAHHIPLIDSQEKQAPSIKKWKDRYYPFNCDGKEMGWHSGSFNDELWPEISVPGRVEDLETLKNFNGVIWFRKTIRIPETFKSKELWLHLGIINDFDEVYFNGQKIGASDGHEIWRTYPLSPELIRFGQDNTLAVRVFNPSGDGGFMEKQAGNMVLCADRWSVVEPQIALSGKWKYRVSEILDKPVDEKVPPVIFDPNSHFTSLYNGMVHPFVRFKIKGAIWYQGESNVKNASHYQSLFSELISDWRSRWGYNFPFMFVQLANFRSGSENYSQPGRSIWAELREAQAFALTIEKTGMVTAIDIGDPLDIHPKNKNEVGRRLSLVAQKLVYNCDVNCYSPVFKSMSIEGNKIRLKFDHTDGGWRLKNSEKEIAGFSIADSSRNFVWAKAVFEGTDVIVYADQISKPVAVRYAWTDNPEKANLSNSTGLPALPFRTDNWEY